MNKKEQIKHFDNFIEKMRNILLAKGDDYAGEENRLANFENVGAIAHVSPEVSCLVAIATKTARLGVLLSSNNKPKNESIRDSVLDLANYTVLLDAIMSEKEKKASTTIICAKEDYEKSGVNRC